MSTLLEIRDMYGGYEEGVKVLRGINLRMEQGEAVGIIGLNGSGKSTLGKAVMNLLSYRTGTVLLEGQDVSNDVTHELAQKGIALMHQGGLVFPNLTAWQNLTLAWGSKAGKTYDQLKDIIPLLQQSKASLMNCMADTLSGGQRHELALAMTLARNPKLVILDEPSAGLSPKAVDKMYEMLAQMREQFGISILLIEQNIVRAVEFCDRSLLLAQGTIMNEFVGSELDEIERIMFES